MDNLENNLLLILLLDFVKTSRFLDSVNFSIIQNIKWNRLYTKTPYNHFDTNTNTYTNMLTEYSEDKFVFTIQIKNTNEPIQITCINSHELDKKDIQSYKYIGSYDSLEKILKIPNIDKFIHELSKNKLMYILEMLGFILGYLVNNNLNLLGITE